MQDLRQYIIAIVAAAIVVAMTEKISTNKHTQRIIKMVSGLFLSIVLLSPFSNISILSYTSYLESVDLEAKEAVIYGEDIYKDNLEAIITERCESYILDKANQLGVTIDVNIQCDTTDIPIPIYVEITGSVSPYIRKTLQNMITQDIGIPEEKQLWI